MNILIYTTIRNWLIQQSTTVTWVMGGRVAYMRPIYTSSFNIKYSTFVRGRVAGLLWPISTSTNITTMITYNITRGRVAGCKILMSMSFISQRNFKTFFFKSFIAVTTTRGRMDGLMQTISYSSSTTHIEKTCSADQVGPALLVWLMDSGNELRQYQSINCVRFQVLLMSVTGRFQGSGA